MKARSASKSVAIMLEETKQQRNTCNGSKKTRFLRYTYTLNSLPPSAKLITVINSTTHKSMAFNIYARSAARPNAAAMTATAGLLAEAAPVYLAGGAEPDGEPG